MLHAGDSVVRVLSTACGLGIEGSGWAVEPGLVVTNAHVVAGDDDTTVTTQDGAELRSDADLLRPAPGPGAAAGRRRRCRRCRSAPSAGRGDAGAVLGYPENGPYALAPARLGETRDDDQRGLLRQRPDRADDRSR